MKPSLRRTIDLSYHIVGKFPKLCLKDHGAEMWGEVAFEAFFLLDDDQLSLNILCIMNNPQ